MNKELLDIYTDYLICSFGQTTATGLSALLTGAISHDRITRFLSDDEFKSSDLWKFVKPHVRKIQSDDAVLVIDDCIQEKPHTDQSELICWHFDHAKGENVKGINMMSALYTSKGISLPVAFELIKKTEQFIDAKTGKQKQKCKKTKNEYYREMISATKRNGLPFKYVVNDVWYSSAENMCFVKQTIQSDFVMPIKCNRKVALSSKDKLAGRFVKVSELSHEQDTVLPIWLEGVDFELSLIKQVFTNEDGSQGVLYLATSDTSLSSDDIKAIYHKRWKVEEYHKCIKQNTSFAKSPTRTVTTQSNHFFSSICAYVKLSLLSCVHKLNHFAMKAKLYQAALGAAYRELHQLKACLPALGRA